MQYSVLNLLLFLLISIKRKIKRKFLYKKIKKMFLEL